MNNIFFELLQVALGRREVLSTTPSADQWARLMEECCRQALQGIAFQGVQRLPREQWPSVAIILRWTAMSEQIRRRNVLTTEVCQRLADRFCRDGFNTCILKGQANHAYYPASLATMRVSGDVDIWVVPQDESAHPVSRTLSYLQGHGLVVSLCWLHAEVKPVGGVPVEVHFHPSFMNTPWLNRRFLALFRGADCFEEAEVDGVTRVRKLRVDYDLLFQLNHVFRHLLDEGVGLRQVVDYYMLLKAYAEAHGDGRLMRRDALLRHIRHCGMGRFCAALMYVLREVLAMPEGWMLCQPSERDGRFLLSEIMASGNFGHYDERMQALEVRSGKTSYQVRRAWRRILRNLRFVGSYPCEVAFEPVARFWHFVYRRFHLYRF